MLVLPHWHSLPVQQPTPAEGSSFPRRQFSYLAVLNQMNQRTPLHSHSGVEKVLLVCVKYALVTYTPKGRLISQRCIFERLGGHPRHE